MATDHRQLLQLLDDLMKPISTVTVPTSTKENEQILTINLIFTNACERFNEAHPLLSSSISVTADHPVYYRYLQIHLHILEILLYQETAQLSSAGEAHLPLFSIQDEAIIYRSLSFVVLLGLILHFDEGISLSLEKYFQNTPTSIHLSKLKCDLSHHDRMFFLNETLERLMHWIQKNPTTSSIVQRLSSHHLLELLLSHLQLLFSPNLKYSSKEYSKSHLQNNFDELKRQFSTGFIQQLILLNRFLATTINSPMWLRQKCGELFTSILIDPNHSGVLKIFQIILDSSSAPSHDRLYVSLAQILSACPKQLSPDVYLQSIKFQMLELFRQPKYRPIINIALDQLWKKYPKLIEKEIFAELFRVLFVLGNPPATEIATADEWERFLNDLESLTEVPSNQAIRSYLLENHLSALINLHLALEKSLSADRERFFRIIVQLFSSIDVERALEYFQMILFRMKHTPLVFHPEQSSTIRLTVDPEGDNDLEFFGQTICKILFQIEDQSRLIVRLFLQLLQSLITKGKEDSAMMMWTEKEKQKMIEQLLIMDVLKRILEYLTEHVNIVIDHLDDTIRVIQIVLNKLTESCQHKSTSIISESDDDFADDEILQIVLTIASLFITQYEQLSFENKQKLTSLYSSLKWIEEHHPSSEFRQLTHELSVAFLTFGAVKGVASARTETSTKKKILIEELDDSQRDLRAETFSNAWACLNDSSLPIRAHGLILFRRLIEHADGETLKSIDDPQRKLFEKFQAHLQAEDSYEYLAAINVLSALTNRYTEKILPILCDEYVNQSQTSRKIEDLLKVGEILVKTTRQLGDLSSKYASRLINTFLYASKKTDDSLYRASALSNLGQLCTVLKYSLSKDLVEILVALKSYLSIFESAEVRRAAILVCELLCQSLEQSTWLTILGDQLTSFYQLIKHLYQSDRDDVVRLHAQLALEALNQICREFLQPSTKLEKQIRILS